MAGEEKDAGPGTEDPGAASPPGRRLGFGGRRAYVALVGFNGRSPAPFQVPAYSFW